MDNTENRYNEEIQKCPYHSALKAEKQNPPENSENKDAEANTGDWNKQRDDSRTDDSEYNTNRNDNSGGAGSTGSASSNS